MKWENVRKRKNSEAWRKVDSKKTITVEYFKNPNGTYSSILIVSGTISSFGVFLKKSDAKNVLLKYMKRDIE